MVDEYKRSVMVMTRWRCWNDEIWWTPSICVLCGRLFFLSLYVIDQAKLRWFSFVCSLSTFYLLVSSFSSIFWWVRFPQSEFLSSLLNFLMISCTKHDAMWFCYFVHDFSESLLSVHRDERHNVSMCVGFEFMYAA